MWKRTRRIAPVTASAKIIFRFSASQSKTVIVLHVIARTYARITSAACEDNWSRYLSTSETSCERAIRPRVERTLSIHACTTHFGSEPPPESEGWVKVACCRCPLALVCFCSVYLRRAIPRPTIRTSVSVRGCIRARRWCIVTWRRLSIPSERDKRRRRRARGSARRRIPEARIRGKRRIGEGHKALSRAQSEKRTVASRWGGTARVHNATPYRLIQFDSLWHGVHHGLPIRDNA